MSAPGWSWTAVVTMVSGNRPVGKIFRLGVGDGAAAVGPPGGVRRPAPEVAAVNPPVLVVARDDLRVAEVLGNDRLLDPMPVDAVRGRRAVDAPGAVGPLAAVDDLVPLRGRRARVFEDRRRGHRPAQGAVRAVDDVVLGRAPPVDRPDGRLRPLDAVLGLRVAEVVAVGVLLALRLGVARHLVVAGVVEAVAAIVVDDRSVQGEAGLPGVLHLDHRLGLDAGLPDLEPDAPGRLPLGAEGVGPRDGVAGLDEAPVDEYVLLRVQLLPDHQRHWGLLRG